MNRLHVIHAIIDKIQAKTYLEIGVQAGKILRKIKCQRKIGVDPGFRFPLDLKLLRLVGASGFKAVELTSDEFFEQRAEKMLQGGIDVALVDGLHTYEQSLRDVQNCLKYLNPGGVIVMHDCNPLNEAMAWRTTTTIDEVKALARKGEVPGWNNVWNGDVWKAVLHLRKEHPELNTFTLDLDHGLGVVSKRPVDAEAPAPPEVATADILGLDYAYLEKDRKAVLNLQPPKYLDTFLR